MKLFIFILLFCNFAFAKGWYFPVGKNGAKKGYAIKSKCERIEQQQCFDIKEKNVLTHLVKAVQVDDLTKPVFELKSNITVCDGVDDCYGKIFDGFCPTTHFAVVSEDLDEVYCTKQAGYQKRLENQLVEDSALKENYDNAKATKAAEKTTRKNKRTTRTNALKVCVNTLKGSPTDPQVKDCLLKLVKEVIRLELTVDDL